MKVGDYVRLKSGEIKKINNLDDLYFDHSYEEEDIVISSPNIIDLIEVGDYVNGSRVVEVVKKDDFNPEPFVVIESTEYAESLDDEYIQELFNLTCTNNDIKSIVTKEQFSQTEYKVGE